MSSGEKMVLVRVREVQWVSSPLPQYGAQTATLWQVYPVYRERLVYAPAPSGTKANA